MVLLFLWCLCVLVADASEISFSPGTNPELPLIWSRDSIWSVPHPSDPSTFTYLVDGNGHTIEVNIVVKVLSLHLTDVTLLLEYPITVLDSCTFTDVLIQSSPDLQTFTTSDFKLLGSADLVLLHLIITRESELDEGILLLANAKLIIDDDALFKINAPLLVVDANTIAWGVGGGGRTGTEEESVHEHMGVVSDEIFTTISGGYHHSLGINEEGNLFSWGVNAHGQLGLDHTSNVLVPTKVDSLTNVVQASAGVDFSLARTSDGFVYSWGSYVDYALGRIQTENSLKPEVLPFIKPVVYISAGHTYGLVVLDDGDVYVWGKNDEGQLGVGDRNDRQTPVRNTHATYQRKVLGCENFSFFLSLDDRLQSSGHNGAGQCCTGNSGQTVSPRDIADHSSLRVAEVQCGELFTYFMTTSGDLYVCGIISPATGNGANSPYKIDIPNVRSIAAGKYHAFALQASGELYSWSKDSKQPSLVVSQLGEFIAGDFFAGHLHYFYFPIYEPLIVSSGESLLQVNGTIENVGSVFDFDIDVAVSEAGAIHVKSGALNFAQFVHHSGIISATDTFELNFSDLILDSGIITSNSSIVYDYAYSITGFGTLNCDVINHGVISPSGVIEISHSLILGSYSRLSFNNKETNVVQLIVSETVDFGGSIHIDFTHHELAAGLTFTLMTYSTSEIVHFDSITVKWHPLFSLDFTSTSLEITTLYDVASYLNQVAHLSPFGTDEDYCGIEVLPCLSLSKVQQRMGYSGLIYLHGGDYNGTVFDVQLENVTYIFQGWKSSFDLPNVVLSNTTLVKNSDIEFLDLNVSCSHDDTCFDILNSRFNFTNSNVTTTGFSFVTGSDSQILIQNVYFNSELLGYPVFDLDLCYLTVLYSQFVGGSSVLLVTGSSVAFEDVELIIHQLNEKHLFDITRSSLSLKLADMNQISCDFSLKSIVGVFLSNVSVTNMVLSESSCPLLESLQSTIDVEDVFIENSNVSTLIQCSSSELKMKHLAVSNLNALLWFLHRLFSSLNSGLTLIDIQNSKFNSTDMVVGDAKTSSFLSVLSSTASFSSTSVLPLELTHGSLVLCIDSYLDLMDFDVFGEVDVQDEFTKNSTLIKCSNSELIMNHLNVSNLNGQLYEISHDSTVVVSTSSFSSLNSGLTLIDIENSKFNSTDMVIGDAKTSSFLSVLSSTASFSSTSVLSLELIHGSLVLCIDSYLDLMNFDVVGEIDVQGEFTKNSTLIKCSNSELIMNDLNVSNLNGQLYEISHDSTVVVSTSSFSSLNCGLTLIDIENSKFNSTDMVVGDAKTSSFLSVLSSTASFSSTSVLSLELIHGSLVLCIDSYLDLMNFDVVGEIDVQSEFTKNSTLIKCSNSELIMNDLNVSNLNGQLYQISQDSTVVVSTLSFSSLNSGLTLIDFENSKFNSTDMVIGDAKTSSFLSVLSSTASFSSTSVLSLELIHGSLVLCIDSYLDLMNFDVVGEIDVQGEFTKNSTLIKCSNSELVMNDLNVSNLNGQLYEISHDSTVVVSTSSFSSLNSGLTLIDIENSKFNSTDMVIGDAKTSSFLSVLSSTASFSSTSVLSLELIHGSLVLCIDSYLDLMDFDVFGEVDVQDEFTKNSTLIKCSNSELIMNHLNVSNLNGQLYEISHDSTVVVSTSSFSSLDSGLTLIDIENSKFNSTDMVIGDAKTSSFLSVLSSTASFSSTSVLSLELIHGSLVLCIDSYLDLMNFDVVGEIDVQSEFTKNSTLIKCSNSELIMNDLNVSNLNGQLYQISQDSTVVVSTSSFSSLNSGLTLIDFENSKFNSTDMVIGDAKTSSFLSVLSSTASFSSTSVLSLELIHGSLVLCIDSYLDLMNFDVVGEIDVQGEFTKNSTLIKCSNSELVMNDLNVSNLNGQLYEISHDSTVVVSTSSFSSLNSGLTLIDIENSKFNSTDMVIGDAKTSSFLSVLSSTASFSSTSVLSLELIHGSLVLCIDSYLDLMNFDVVGEIDVQGEFTKNSTLIKCSNSELIMNDLNVSNLNGQLYEISHDSTVVVSTSSFSSLNSGLTLIDIESSKFNSTDMVVGDAKTSSFLSVLSSTASFSSTSVLSLELIHGSLVLCIDSYLDLMNFDVVGEIDVQGEFTKNSTLIKCSNSELIMNDLNVSNLYGQLYQISQNSTVVVSTSSFSSLNSGLTLIDIENSKFNSTDMVIGDAKTSSFLSVLSSTASFSSTSVLSLELIHGSLVLCIDSYLDLMDFDVFGEVDVQDEFTKNSTLIKCSNSELIMNHLNVSNLNGQLYEISHDSTVVVSTSSFSSLDSGLTLIDIENSKFNSTDMVIGDAKTSSFLSVLSSTASFSSTSVLSLELIHGSLVLCIDSYLDLMNFDVVGEIDVQGEFTKNSTLIKCSNSELIMNDLNVSNLNGQLYEISHDSTVVVSTSSFSSLNSGLTLIDIENSKFNSTDMVVGDAKTSSFLSVLSSTASFSSSSVMSLELIHGSLVLCIDSYLDLMNFDVVGEIDVQGEFTKNSTLIKCSNSELIMNDLNVSNLYGQLYQISQNSTVVVSTSSFSSLNSGLTLIDIENSKFNSTDMVIGDAKTSSFLSVLSSTASFSSTSVLSLELIHGSLVLCIDSYLDLMDFDVFGEVDVQDEFTKNSTLIKCSNSELIMNHLNVSNLNGQLYEISHDSTVVVSTSSFSSLDSGLTLIDIENSKFNSTDMVIGDAKTSSFLSVLSSTASFSSTSVLSLELIHGSLVLCIDSYLDLMNFDVVGEIDVQGEFTKNSTLIKCSNSELIMNDLNVSNLNGQLYEISHDSTVVVSTSSFSSLNSGLTLIDIENSKFNSTDMVVGDAKTSSFLSVLSSTASFSSSSVMSLELIHGSLVLCIDSYLDLMNFDVVGEIDVQGEFTKNSTLIKCSNSELIMNDLNVSNLYGQLYQISQDSTVVVSTSSFSSLNSGLTLIDIENSKFNSTDMVVGDAKTSSFLSVLSSTACFSSTSVLSLELIHGSLVLCIDSYLDLMNFDVVGEIDVQGEFTKKSTLIKCSNSELIMNDLNVSNLNGQLYEISHDSTVVVSTSSFSSLNSGLTMIDIENSKFNSTDMVVGDAKTSSFLSVLSSTASFSSTSVLSLELIHGSLVLCIDSYLDLMNFDVVGEIDVQGEFTKNSTLIKCSNSELILNDLNVSNLNGQLYEISHDSTVVVSTSSFSSLNSGLTLIDIENSKFNSTDMVVGDAKTSSFLSVLSSTASFSSTSVLSLELIHGSLVLCIDSYLDLMTFDVVGEIDVQGEFTKNSTLIKCSNSELILNDLNVSNLNGQLYEISHDSTVVVSTSSFSSLNSGLTLIDIQNSKFNSTDMVIGDVKTSSFLSVLSSTSSFSSTSVLPLELTHGSLVLCIDSYLDLMDFDVFGEVDVQDEFTKNSTLIKCSNSELIMNHLNVSNLNGQLYEISHDSTVVVSTSSFSSLNSGLTLIDIENSKFNSTDMVIGDAKTSSFLSVLSSTASFSSTSVLSLELIHGSLVLCIDSYLDLMNFDVVGEIDVQGEFTKNSTLIKCSNSELIMNDLNVSNLNGQLYQISQDSTVVVSTSSFFFS
ncbi:hypothetical protein GEMRC1_000021 [Eukaryota sp. GEM-RC1]